MIEKNVPIPPKRGRDMNYPELLELKRGECEAYDVPEDEDDAKKLMAKIRMAVSWITRRSNGQKRFVTRLDAETNKFRVWLK